MSRSTLDNTALNILLQDSTSWLSSGKMLRSRLIGTLAEASQQPRETLIAAAAAVEMIHAASLLHDDVIDGGYLRRNEPSFWVERGVPGAILVGDLLLFKALELTCKTGYPLLTQRLVEMTGEVCMAESEQELVHRGVGSSWDICVSIARRKTGALFAFCTFSVGTPGDEKQCDALTESGFEAGTAYQLSDDVLDATGEIGDSGKTLGTDAERDKLTAMRVLDAPGNDPANSIHDLLNSSVNRLSDWPELQTRWDHYVAEVLRPAIDKNLSGFTALKGEYAPDMPENPPNRERT